MKLENLAGKIQELNSSGGVPFMEGRTLGKIAEGVVHTLDNYGFIHGEDGEYVVLSFEEYPDFFFFGGSVVTQKIKDLSDVLADAGIEDLTTQDSGVPVIFEKKKNKSGKKEYMTCTFFPEV